MKFSTTKRVSLTQYFFVLSLLMVFGIDAYSARTDLDASTPGYDDNIKVNESPEQTQGGVVAAAAEIPGTVDQDSRPCDEVVTNGSAMNRPQVAEAPTSPLDRQELQQKKGSEASIPLRAPAAALGEVASADATLKAATELEELLRTLPPTFAALASPCRG